MPSITVTGDHTMSAFDPALTLISAADVDIVLCQTQHTGRQALHSASPKDDPQLGVISDDSLEKCVWHTFKD